MGDLLWGGGHGPQNRPERGPGVLVVARQGVVRGVAVHEAAHRVPALVGPRGGGAAGVGVRRHDEGGPASPGGREQGLFVGPVELTKTFDIISVRWMWSFFL